jgi:hypothetical protein
MSDHTAALPEPGPSSGQGSGPGGARRTSRGVIAVVASVVAVVLVAVGGFAAWRFFGPGGPRPAEVLPDSTFALVTVDLDPAGGQKVEALKTLRKFPGLRARLSGSDLMKSIFDEALGDGPCKELDYERDVQPWIGSRVGIGGVLLGDDRPAPVMALQVKDAAEAKTGFAALAKCSGADDDEDFGWTTTDDYVVVSDSTNHAEGIVAAGKKSSLAADAAFQKWTDEAGGAGIVNAYLGRTSVEVLSDLFGSELGGLTGGPEEFGGGFDEGGSGEGDSEGADEDVRTELNEAMKDFKGAAAMLRFEDGGIELSFAGGGTKATRGEETVTSHVAALPADTALVLALAVPSGAFDQLAKVGQDGETGADFLSEMTGLDLPDDLETLLGRSISLSLGGDAPSDLESVQGPGDLPLGALIRGDVEKIEAVVSKIEKKSGQTLADVPATMVSEDGKVAIASTPEYAEQLLGAGSLSDDEGFQDAVPHADDAQAIAYVDLDGDWKNRLLDLIEKEDDEDAKEAARNLAVLRGFGASAWTEGDTSHGLVRLSLK